MKLHSISFKGRAKKRVGRGGKRGTTAGRGTKGQKSRSGHVIRPAERDLILKLPKKRGFRNKPKSERACVLNVSDLSKGLAGRSAHGAVAVTSDVLREAGLIGARFRGIVKILGEGNMKFAVAIAKDIQVSKSARQKIEAAGGSVGK